MKNINLYILVGVLFLIQCGKSTTEDNSSLIISPNTKVISSERTSFEVQIKTNEDWFISSNIPSWVSVSEANGYGTTTVIFTLDANTSKESRTALIKVRDIQTEKTLSITQKGVETGEDSNTPKPYSKIKTIETTEIKFANNSTSTSKTECSYNSQNLITGIKSYLNGVLSSESINYVYGDKYSQYTSIIYSNGVKTFQTDYKITYIDDNYLLYKVFEYSQIANNSISTSKTEYSYNSKNLYTGIKSYSNGVLSSESINYVYGDKYSQHSIITYSSGEKVSQQDWKTTYLYDDYRYATIYEILQIVGNVTHINKTEYSYNSQNLTIGMKSFYDGVLLSECINYVYGDKYSQYTSINYSNGVKVSQQDCKITYLY